MDIINRFRISVINPWYSDAEGSRLSYISTKWAYEEFDKRPLRNTENNFELLITSKYPIINEIKEQLKNNGAIRLTVSKYYLPSGKSISEVGVTPDILVEEEGEDFLINSEKDNQLNYAIKLFNS